MNKFIGFGDDLPVDDNPIIATEQLVEGWRGLTSRGELIDVRGNNGHAVTIPEDMLITRDGVAIARRKIEKNASSIVDYLRHYDRALTLTRDNLHREALAEIERAHAIAPTLYARFNRAMIMLALGRWRDGFAEYRACEDLPPLVRAPVALALAAGLKPWRGEDLAGKTILLLHAHGFGDSIMALRYVPLLQARGARVILQVPRELLLFAVQFAEVTAPVAEVDYFCPLLHLVGLLGGAPDASNLIESGPYLRVDREAVQDWHELLGPGHHIGLAWTPGVQSTADFPRGIPLDQLVAAITTIAPGSQLHSIQQQGIEEAQALGLRAYQFGDFSDCAAAMASMDQIISIDTAALHLAGAIGHCNVVGLLSYWHSWRWLAPWYSNVKLVRQRIAGDWAGALAQME